MLKTITFFNEKGGSGKTTFSAIFASWLCYDQGEKVMVLDFDSPSYHFEGFRKLDKFYNTPENKGFNKMCMDAGTPYPVEAIKNDEGFSQEALNQMCRMLSMRKEAEDGYLIMDFPGSLRINDAITAFSKEGLIDLMVLPMTADSQTRISAIRVFNRMHSEVFKQMSGKPHGQESIFFWNEVTQTELQAKNIKYNNYEQKLKDKIGAEFCKTMVKQIPILRRDPENPFVFVRSTMCYPKMNIKRYCPYIEDLFKEIKDKLDSIH